MSHNRRARPTIRMLAEDLTSGWGDAQPARHISAQDWDALHPLADLDHPVVHKAAEQFGPDPAEDLVRDVIRCSGDLRLLEVRAGQWRAGVWTDPDTGVRWTCAAGLAKGEHRDHDDFYRQLAGKVDNPVGLLPTELDRRLLKRETAAHLLTTWELEVQRLVGDALRAALEAGGRSSIELPHPSRPVSMASLDVSIGMEDDAEVITATVALATEFRSGDLGWALTTRTLVTLSPPAQSWDRYQNVFVTMNEPGYAVTQAGRIPEICARGELLAVKPGEVSHYVHRAHIADACVDGEAVRALCGVFFVPYQDHEGRHECAECSTVYSQLH